MRSILRVALLALFPVLSGQTASSQGAAVERPKATPIQLGEALTVHSATLNEDRTVRVALPDGYGASTESYPVFYLVDAQWNFNLTATAIHVLAANGLIPPMIVVGIDTEANRERDLLPAQDEDRMGGGADATYRFLSAELIPFVEQAYRTQPYRLLGGTSYGGVFVMHAFMTDPGRFGSYFAMSPAMRWNGGVMLKRAKAFLPANPSLRNHLYVTVANEGPGMGVNALAALLDQLAPKDLKWRFDAYPEEVHGTICYKSTYNGLKFAFAGWSAKVPEFTTAGGLLNPGDAVLVRIQSDSKEVRYTLDGTEPTGQSPLYDKPVKLTKPATVKARPFYGYGLPGCLGSLEVRPVVRLNAEARPPALKSGLKFAYYEGRWDRLPDFAKLVPNAKGVTAGFRFDGSRRPEDFGFLYSGYLDVPEDALYTFFLLSDDGSRLVLDGQTLIDNDGLHGNIERRGQAFLNKGKHRLAVSYFQQAGGAALILGYETDTMSRREIPSKALFHAE